MTAQILTQEYLHTLFDYKDGSLYWKVKTSNRIKIGTKAGTIAKRGNLNININKKLHKAHRLIFMMHYGYVPKIIDHIDGNPLNNCIKNLRPATELQNHHNMGISKRNTSGIKGVCWDKSKNKWLARCNFDYKAHHVGYFDKIEEAKKSIELYRNYLHGEFARHK
jgi:hypothetical protein